MEHEIVLNLYEIVGSEYCVAAEDGQAVFQQISTAIQQKIHVVLSFKNVNRVTSAFLNVAVGQLYGVFQEKDIRDFLGLVDITNSDLVLLKRVVDTAKSYFRNRGKFKQHHKTLVEDSSDDAGD